MRPLTGTVKRSDPAGWAEYGCCASPSRFCRGLRLRLICTLQGLPVAFALSGATADERETLLDLLTAEPHLLAARPSRTVIGDNNYAGRTSEHELAQQGIELLRTPSARRQRTTTDPLELVTEMSASWLADRPRLRRHLPLAGS
ncbi:hypothetical protein ACIP3A_32970 [Streptomyces tricolor]|uniref:hypothetical protein n=1 Tax=Streptomyces tricolor TaxID=68277 RepID=UPI00382679D2